MSESERIDCREAADRLYEYLDGELTAAAEDEVRAHLAACAPCLGLFDFEDAYLRFLEARARSATAPPALRRRILEEILLDGADAS